MLDLLLCQLSSTAAQHRTEEHAEVAATLAGGLAKLLMQQVLQQEGAPARLDQCDTVKVGALLLRACSVSEKLQDGPQSCSAANHHCGLLQSQSLYIQSPFWGLRCCFSVRLGTIAHHCTFGVHMPVLDRLTS